jgi:hypothetical protein
VLQILFWVCYVIILGIGYCAIYLEKLAARDKVKGNTGVAFFFVTLIIAGAIAALSIMQGKGIIDLLNR